MYGSWLLSRGAVLSTGLYDSYKTKAPGSELRGLSLFGVSGCDEGDHASVVADLDGSFLAEFL